MNKNVVLVTTYPLFDEPVVLNRLSAFIKQFASRGWSVSVVAPNSKIEGKRLVEDYIGARVVHVKVANYNRNNFFIRALSEMFYSLKLLRIASSLKVDFAIVTVPSMFLLMLSSFRAATIQVLDIRDLAWEYIPTNSALTRLIKSVLCRWAIASLRRADILTASNPFEISYIANLSTKAKPILVSNGIGRDQFDSLSHIRIKNVLDKKLRITYIGNVGVAQNLSTLVGAVAGKDCFDVKIVGAGTEIETIKSKVKALGANNVRFFGRVSWHEIPSFYEDSDILYTQLSPSFNSAVPSKLYEYLATGLPVVYGGSGAAVELLREFEHVKIVKADSVVELKEAFLELLEAGKIDKSTLNISIVENKYIREIHVEALETQLEKHLSPSTDIDAPAVTMDEK